MKKLITCKLCWTETSISFHRGVQTAVSGSPGNFETRWSPSHTTHHKRAEGWGGAKGIGDLAVFHVWLYYGIYYHHQTRRHVHTAHAAGGTTMLQWGGNSFPVWVLIIRMTRLVLIVSWSSCGKGMWSADSSLTSHCSYWFVGLFFNTKPASGFQPTLSHSDKRSRTIGSGYISHTTTLTSGDILKWFSQKKQPVVLSTSS